MSRAAVYLHAPGLVCALGQGVAQVRRALWDAGAPDGPDSPDGQDNEATPAGLTQTAHYSPGRSLWLGQVRCALPDLGHLAPAFRVRNNAIALLALAQMRAAVDGAIECFGAQRVAVVVGTSTSGMAEGEAARAHRQRCGAWPPGFGFVQQELGNLAAFVAAQLGVGGPAHVISTACSSGAKALVSGARLLQAGLADAVVAGGCDALGAFTVAGFSALESVAPGRCNPMSRNRCGINLGEGAAFFLMTRTPAAVRLAGWGESSDAHHMSAPDPAGLGAIDAMRAALARAGLAPAAVDYLNLHGTATQHNDAMESLAVAHVFGSRLAASSTKPLTGHALAAAGAIEAALGWITLTGNPQGRLPPHCWDGVADPALAPLHLVAPGERLGRAPRHVLSNSFAFGGSNACLLLAGA